MHEPLATKSRSRRTLKFDCGSCGLLLEVDASQAGVSGPCPACSAWIQSPLQTHDPSAAEEHRIPSPGSSRPARHDGRKKGRISADMTLDHAHIEQRETVQTLKVIIIFILAVCICVGASWFITARMGM